MPTAQRFSSTQEMVSTVLWGVGFWKSLSPLILLLDLRHIIIPPTEALQVGKHPRVLTPNRYPLSRAARLRRASLGGLSLHLHGDAGIAPGCLAACVTQEVTDAVRIGAGLEHVDRGGMSDHMRMDVFASDCRVARFCGPDVLLENMSEAPPRQRPASQVREDEGSTFRHDIALRQERTQQLGRLAPQRDHSLLSTLAHQPYPGRRGELQVTRPQAQDLLDASARLVGQA